jgi:anti-sigma factor RsiW
MGRPFDKHIDEQELNALVPSCIDGKQRVYRADSDSPSEAECHIASCAACREKVAQYRRLVHRMDIGASALHAAEAGCPTDIDWHEVAAGLWPELRTQQLISHAAHCAHCGPLLHAATSGDEPTPQEEEFLAQLKAPSRPALQSTRVPALANQRLSIWRQLWDWKVLVPAGAMVVLVAILILGRFASSSPLSGRDLAEFAASTHRRHLRGNLALEEQTDSQALLNEWLHGKSQFALALPASSETPRERLPYRIEGARLIGIRNKTAAYIAYRMQPDLISLIVTPVSVAVASGGAEVSFKNVTFHYYSIEGYKVVTWSVHGLTYALVSQEGNRTQRSCMVCHSTMRDRDLTNTPTPLGDQKTLGATHLR